MAKIFNCNTTFDNENNTMTFHVHKRLDITINWTEYEVVIVKDGKVKDRESYKGEPFSIGELQRIVTMGKESVEKLEKL